jgi:predicted AlkP superfamily pyrophosphatase or phosphodiesterase
MRSAALPLVLVAALTALAFGSGTRPATHRPPLVLLSIDGLRPDYVLDAQRYGLALPELRRLLREGSFASGVVGVLPTVTYPSHTTLVTGVWPARHGIVANGPFDPEGRNQDGWYWYAEDIRVPTLWDAAARQGMVTANVAWPVTVGAHITHNIPQYWRYTPDDAKLARALSTPGLLGEVEEALGPFPAGDAGELGDDRRRSEACAYLIETRRPQLSLCYLTALDADQHTYGPGSREALATLEAQDTLVGQVRAAAERAAGGPVTLAVVSDHGFFRTERELHLNAALRQAGLISLDAHGALASWKAFAWSSGGSAAVYLHDPRDTASRQRLAAVLQTLAADPANGIESVLDPKEARARGGFPDAAFVVAARPDCHLGSRFELPVLRLASGGGTHGMLSDHREMDAAFFIAGPDVPVARDLGRIDMRDIAPTLAALLQLPLATADGHDLFHGGRGAAQP